MERLQKVIANRGYCSRRKAEELILQKKVKVNGEVISELGVKIDDNAMIEIEGQIIVREEKEYILLNKPRGVVTTTKDDKHRETVSDLIVTDKRLYPVGRLDYDTTGALLLTNDGELTNLLLHPKNEIDKVYIAKVRGLLTSKDIAILKSGVIINGVKTAKAKVKVKKFDKKNKTTIVEITIHEGKNHQIKNMLMAVGYEVLKLKREKIAFLDVKSLKSGEYRYLTIKEVKQLYNLVKNK
ncbi:MAG: pseudouridine synthase [Bacilli bacterium]|nr:pseudouridine synthase [Bacilli bacterium]MDD4809300.1 pseudouridine synthase [Bacilli bacterium]